MSMSLQPAYGHGNESRQNKKVLSNLIRGFFCSVAFLGTQGAWAVQIGNVSSTLKQLGLSDSKLSLMWLAGPLTGITIQPIVGIASDVHVSRWGRRRPFIVLGSLLTSIGLLCFGFVTTIYNQGVALALAAPLRMLLTDAVESHLLDYGNACFALNNGMGKTIGYLLGGLCLSTSKAFGFFTTETSAVFTVMTIISVITVAITVFMVDESPALPNGEDGQKTFGEKIVRGLDDLYSTYTRLPHVFWWAFAIQCSAYFAWFSTFIFVAIWMGQMVYGGQANHNDLISDGCSAESPFVNGIQMANWGFLTMTSFRHAGIWWFALVFYRVSHCTITALVSLFWAPCLPKLCYIFGLKAVWIGHLVVLGVVLCITPAVRLGQDQGMILTQDPHQFAIALISLLGFPLAATFSLPWQIATTVCSGDNDARERGKTMTIFNLSQSIPEIIISIVAGPIVSINNLPTNALVLGGSGALLGAVLCARFLNPADIHAYEMTKKQRESKNEV